MVPIWTKSGSNLDHFGVALGAILDFGNHSFCRNDMRTIIPTKEMISFDRFVCFDANLVTLDACLLIFGTILIKVVPIWITLGSLWLQFRILATPFLLSE